MIRGGRGVGCIARVVRVHWERSRISSRESLPLWFVQGDTRSVTVLRVVRCFVLTGCVHVARCERSSVCRVVEVTLPGRVRCAVLTRYKISYSVDAHWLVRAARTSIEGGRGGPWVGGGEGGGRGRRGGHRATEPVRSAWSEGRTTARATPREHAPHACGTGATPSEQSPPPRPAYQHDEWQRAAARAFGRPQRSL